MVQEIQNQWCDGAGDMYSLLKDVPGLPNWQSYATGCQRMCRRYQIGGGGNTKLVV